ncbi:MAG: hypothetical protein WCK26_03465 [Candidatus Saccharibacteria bacterium]
MKKSNINEQVVVTAMGFRKNLAIYPKRMEFQGKTYDFIDAGLRCLVRHSDRMAEVVTLSDGISNFFLRSDNNGCNWTLISICS